MFTALITLLIVLNTIVLASDRYPENVEFKTEEEWANKVFTYCFLAEMIIKLLGLGVKAYARDGFNLFDATIVVLSMVEIAAVNIDPALSTGGAFSAFRSVRLLRVFKLARSWTSFRNLLKVMIETIKDVQTFAILLAICMLIMALLGMELFGHRIKYDKYDNAVKDPSEYDENTLHSPRPNFDDIGMAFVTIFVVFIGEDWNNVMYKHQRVIGWMGNLVFPVFYVVLNLILLNLFLAILLKNFDEVVDNDHHGDSDADASALRRLEKKMRRFFRIICSCCAPKIKHKIE